jgi:hypothetical protein
MAKQKIDPEKLTDQMDLLKQKELKVSQFSDILLSIENLDDKKRVLWLEIYHNAMTDRENASILFTDTILQIKGNAANHSILGPVVVKYIERMSRANDQIIKLAELITSEENKPLDTGSIFDKIMED